ncbi:unnamed protein product [Mucor hiemalis]
MNKTTSQTPNSESYFTSKNNKIPSIQESTPLYDLQEVIQQYQSQPELLKLILTSKVEEDKRRAEEAKLRAKELDLYLKHSNTPNSPPTTPRLTITDVIETPKQQPTNGGGKLLSTPNRKNSGRSAPYVISNQFRSYHSSISSASSISSLSDEDMDEEDTTDNHQQRRHSAAAAMLAMGNVAVPETSDQSKKEEESVISSAYPSPVADHYSDEQEDYSSSSNKPRRRREMQAITKIVETREFPYVDNYFWKNNGNTVQKKTGCKSIYYKCSNSNKVIFFFWEYNGIWRGGEASLPDL